ncbi:putative membrane protein [Nocardia nova SH22a]|uniref:Putative membrane protein n=1 Tax=Nocardia nova SH22a TaxID=1415166 RepID=W5TNG7_9NOCA|nr:alpha/beta-hydrolase family protein [Nocardia nova]AHH20513.1 putative membrane protein [Nocardia nova SH22a]
MENSAARGAVRALTGPRPASAVMPADFAASQGYRPVEVDGMPVDPGGQCSSPIPLPGEFDTACKAHDLGYDLLRYAELHGSPLGPWARRAVDATLQQHMFDACATRTATLARLQCDTMAAIATGAVDINSRRQNYAAPMPEYLFGAQLSGTDLGPQLVRILASAAMALLLVAALFAVVRRVIRPGRSGHGDGPRRQPTSHPKRLRESLSGHGMRLWGYLAGYVVRLREHSAGAFLSGRRAVVGLQHAFGFPAPALAGGVATGGGTVPGPSEAIQTTALRISRPGRPAAESGPDTRGRVGSAGREPARTTASPRASATHRLDVTVQRARATGDFEIGDQIDPFRQLRDQRSGGNKRFARQEHLDPREDRANGPHTIAERIRAITPRVHTINPPISAITQRIGAVVRRLGAVVRRIGASGSPRTGTLVATSAGVVASLWPGLLPRTSIAQALLTAILILVSLTVAGIVRKILRRFGSDTERRLGKYRLWIAAACAVAVTGALAHAWLWQNRLRAAMEFPAAGPMYWLHWALGTTAVLIPVLLVVRGLRWAAAYVGRLRSVALVTATVFACQFALLPAVVNWQRSTFATADAAMDRDVVQPVSFTRSGSPESAVQWSSLGAEGRKFVSERGLSVRVYIGLNSAPDLESRVALAIREIERSGGFERGNLVMMVPTGSGWLDANAAHGLDQRFGGDATLIGMQYSQAPSWATFLFARSDAERSARALFTGIERRLATLAHPPKLYVYGQSLGATAGSAIFTGDSDEARRVCAVLWAGPPASTVHHGNATVLANSSDPVVQWSPRLLWHAPDLGGARRDAPHPPWLPVLSWVQTTADMLSALAPGPGHGHRYGIDQGTTLGSC